jgi:hypothetical protein
MDEAAPPDLAAYVRSSARLLDLALSDEQVARVASHLQRTRALAQALRDVPLAPHDEIAEIFRPAPFPAEDPRC